MLKPLSLSLLIITTLATIHFRLNTNEVTRLNVGDSLISTLGLFKATLLQTECVLSIETFNGNNGYNKVGNYTPDTSPGNCNYLDIIQGTVVTDNNATYMTVGNNFNLSTIMTIDDLGIIRLIGTYQLPDFKNQISIEFNVTTFLTTQKYIFAKSQ